jgi:hypothetical protein
MLKFNQYLEEKFGDICPQCMQDPCVCGGNHISEEQIDEITSNTLQSYRQKAHTQIQHYKYGSGKDKPEASKVLAKREPGMAKATDKVIKKDKERIAAQPKPTPQKSEPYKPLGGRDEKSGRSYSEEFELDEGGYPEVDHMPGRRLSRADTHKVSKYTVATNAKDGHKEHKVKVDASSENHARNLAADHFVKKGLKPRVHFDGVRVIKEEVEQIDELSNDKLDQYKKAAGEDASKQDKAGNFEKGHKRFKGIMKATFKQFANDAKK